MADQRVLDTVDLDCAEDSRLGEMVGFEEAGTWEASVSQFETALVTKLYQDYPSSRKLAERLNTSHSMIAAKLRKHGIPKK